MKKIGILTLIGYVNYGNRLQNYATQEVLKSLGFQVETIINQIDLTTANTKNVIFARISHLRKMNIAEIINKSTFKLWYKMHKQEIERRTEKRIEIFKKFTEDHIVETDYCISAEKMPGDLAERYDYFVSGSDQVWNPFFNSGSPMFFLTFAPACKRIAYSPSFGISEIPNIYFSNYKKWISEMHRVSVREEVGVDIIKKLTGRDSAVLIDPTLMLTKEKWLSVSRRSERKPTESYILIYFLGEVKSEYKIRINKIAKENGLKIIKLADVRDSESYQTGPAEFIDYIQSASLLCTDSFHGVAFSILMETPFIVFERKDNSQTMFSRIDTILNTFGLTDRKANEVLSKEQIFNLDFSHIPSIFNLERKKALDYLKEALNVKDMEE